MKCDNCRTELPNSKGETLKCPECGEEYEDSEEQESSPQKNGELIKAIQNIMNCKISSEQFFKICKLIEIVKKQVREETIKEVKDL